MENYFVEFLLKKGLYDTCQITKDNLHEFISLVGGNEKISSYCKECGQERVYTMNSILFHIEATGQMQELAKQIKSTEELFNMDNVLEPGKDSEPKAWSWRSWVFDEAVRVIVFKFICSMKEEHHLDFVVLTKDNIIIKIGQYPSVADLEFPELEQYKKVIEKQDLREMKRAIGLYAQGIGIGSFTYLRRVLENLIIKAKTEAVNDGHITEEQFEFDGDRQRRVVDKIKLLKEYLPSILVINEKIYGVVSKGIHELSEEECLAYFPIVRDIIFLMLEQWEEKRKKMKLEEDLTKSLSGIVSKY